MEQIKSNVFDYFGCNEAIIQNTYNEDQWNAYYEGCIEPIAIQLSQVMTCMIFTNKEIAAGNQVIFTSDWLQYASNKTKKEVISDFLDRGVISHNESRSILNMSRIDEPWADKYWIRKEYAEITKLQEEEDNAGGSEPNLQGYESAADRTE